ncbi:MAG: EamA family transporter [Planctomycetes bacterium]|nr:EamA family transporter [Planctomycetota bacterium]
MNWGIASLLFARALQRRADVEVPTSAAVNLFKNTLASAVFLIVFLALGEPWPAPEAWPWLVISGLFGFAIGDAIYLAALPLSGVQVVTMVSLVHVPATVCLDWMFLGRALPLITLVWIAVVVAGVWLVVGEKRPGSTATRGTVRAGAILALIAAVSQSVGVILGHEGMTGASVWGGTLVRMIGGIGGALCIAAIVGLFRGSVTREYATITRPLRTRSTLPALTTAALFGSVIGLPLFHFALRGLPSGVASVLFATTPLFTLPLGFFFGERHGLRAVFGTLVGFAGVAGVVFSLS